MYIKGTSNVAMSHSMDKKYAMFTTTTTQQHTKQQQQKQQQQQQQLGIPIISQ